ncbi:MAG TPA: imidazolonepropionase [Terriglobales bacterium]|nr:imidazolonepropionase [Terriglobales bacterium]
MSPEHSQETIRPLLLINIGQLLTLRHPRGAERPRRGPELSELGIVTDAAVLCLHGRIVAAGPEAAISAQLTSEYRTRLDSFDCHGGVVTPGFVDSHTHPVFTSPRLIDFEKRIHGSTYEEIAQAGGGIRSSLDSVRNATEDELSAHVLGALQHMQHSGTTTVEAKSGYGLTVEAELKSLRAIDRAGRQWPGTVVPTLLGAHVVPSEYQGRSDAYVDVVCNDLIPKAAQERTARFVDVFCERGAFSIQQTQRVFEAGRKAGLGARAHVCQFTPQDLSILAPFEPASYDHLDCLTDKDLQALAHQNTIATLLPGASYFLAHSYPLARRLIDAGAAIALATDFNPGTSPTTSMLLVLSMACTQMRMSPAEALSAATINGAHALRFADRKGSIEAGKDADLAVFEVKDYREICYWFGIGNCRATVSNGHLAVHHRSN